MALDKNGKRKLPPNISYDSKRNSYRVDKYYKGERIILYADSVKEAERNLAHRITDIDNHVNPSKDSAITMNQLFELYLTQYKVNLKASSKQHYKWTYSYYIEPYIGTKKLNRLTATDIEKVYNNMIVNHLKQGTVDNTRKLLRTMLNQAVKHDLISMDKNPYNKVDAPRNLVKKEQRSFNEEERDLFLQYAQKSLYRNAYTLMFFTGLREGECCGICLDAVDLEHHILRVRTNLQKARTGDKAFYLETPKTRNSIRDIYLVPEAEEAVRQQIKLRSIILQGKEKQPEEFSQLLFINSKGRPVSQPTIEQDIRRIVARIRRDGHKFADMWCHSIRHGYASIAKAKGMSLDILQANLGHASIETTMRYIQIDERYKWQECMKISS